VIPPINEWIDPVTGWGYRMWYSPDKIGRSFASGTIYERPLLEWIRDQNFQGAALDVGANIGNHALWMKYICGLDVVAFEPVLPHVIRANDALNGGYIDVRDYALGDVPSTAHHKGKGVITPGTSNESTDESFEIKRLDDIPLPDHVAFCKIDVEGFEPNVLRGGVQFLREHKPVLAVEQWGPAASAEVAKVLRPLGYVEREKFGGRGRAPMQVWRMT
jgi:FkbM family methyltransferase